MEPEPSIWRSFEEGDRPWLEVLEAELPGGGQGLAQKLSSPLGIPGRPASDSP